MMVEDFLSRLAARAVGTARVLRPLVRPAIAAQPEAPEEITAQAGREVRVADVTPPQPLITDDGRATERAPELASAPLEEPSQAPSIPRRQDHPSTAISFDRPASAARTVSSALTVPNEKRSPVLQRTKPEPRPLMTLVVEERPSEAGSAALAEAAPHHREEESTPLRLGARHRREQETAPPNPAAPAAAEATQPPTEPMVRVTIGRVEVRAVMKTAPLPPPRPQPSQTLQAYLRGEGKRRR